MGIFSSGKSKLSMLKLHASSIDDAESGLVVLAYRGGDLGVTLQKSKSKWLDAAGPRRIKWTKEQRLGITFCEREDGSISVKKTERNPADVSVGQQLLAVNEVPVLGMDFDAVMNTIRGASSPCILDFTPPPTPILASQVVGEQARRAGVEEGMVLKAINGTDLGNASLKEVQQMLRGSNEKNASLLAFVPFDVFSRSSSSTSAMQNMKAHLRNTICVASVTVAAAFTA